MAMAFTRPFGSAQLRALMATEALAGCGLSASRAPAAAAAMTVLSFMAFPPPAQTRAETGRVASPEKHQAYAVHPLQTTYLRTCRLRQMCDTLPTEVLWPCSACAAGGLMEWHGRATSVGRDDQGALFMTAFVIWYLGQTALSIGALCLFCVGCG